MTEHDTTQPSSEDLQQVEKLQKAYASMKDEMRKIIVGQDEVIDELFMALWRIKRPEALKEHSPADLGRVLGVDRAPEVPEPVVQPHPVHA